MRYEGRAPLRVDLAGGWSDIPPFAEAEGGAVLNAAITRHVTGHISRPDGRGPWMKPRSNHSTVSYSLDLPPGAGLGSSAAQMVLWVALVKSTIENITERCQIAEIACEMAKLMGILGGKQDEYASALGGFNLITFDEWVHPDRLSVPTSVLSDLRARLVLVYSGESRLSADVHEGVWGRYRSGDREAAATLRRLAALARTMKPLLMEGELDSVAELIKENWGRQKELHASITNERIEEIFCVAEANGAVAGKACGAGGGGCLLFMTRENEAGKLRQALSSRKLKIIDFDFDTYGVFIKRC